MNCRLCGFEIEDDLAVCPSCGRPVAKGERGAKAKTAVEKPSAEKPLVNLEVDPEVADARVNTSLLCGVISLLTCAFGIIPQANFGLTGWISYLPVLIPIGSGIASMTFARLGWSSRKRWQAVLGGILSVLACAIAITLVVLASAYDIHQKLRPVLMDH